MSRYSETFSALGRKNEAAFIPFTVAGDPDTNVSEMILKTYIDSGADILEIGYPFSDPIADGPVNQRGAQRAIQSGITPFAFFKLMKRIRTYDSKIPIGLLLYANTVNHPGYASFCKAAKDSGIDSLLVADMPPEEHEELGNCMKSTGLERVFIVSELTPPDRMKMICSKADAFVYVVSRLGTTGTDSSLSSSVASTLSRLRSVTQKPLAVGFGISSAEQVAEVIAAGADGAIIGSALVKLIEAHSKDNKKMLSLISKMVSSCKSATSTSNLRKWR